MGKLTDDTELTPFNDNMILVQRGSRMYVKKIIETADMNIYKKLIGKHCRNVSEVFADKFFVYIRISIFNYFLYIHTSAAL